MGAVRVVFPDGARAFLRDAIAGAGGNEVYFVGRLGWSGEGGEAIATIEKIDLLARGTRTKVLALLQRSEGWDVAIHNHPSGLLEPSDADFCVAHNLAGRGVGFVIISNDADRQYVVVSPFREGSGPVAIDPEEVRAILAPGGPLSRGLQDYEPRPGQIEMALEATRALNEGRILAAEAGTGIGKSFAYLIPSILWAVRNRERVVVSTGTINLQEQLVGKDLPFLARALPFPFHFALIKGRGNYACLRKLVQLKEDMAQQEAFPTEDRVQLESLVEWARTTRGGSKSDLAWVPSPRAWEEIISETETSLKVRCKHYNECFFYAAKREASRSNILVINHHLFFADLSVRRELDEKDVNLVLPPYNRVIFDEAHHLEDVASEHLGVRFSRAGIEARLGRLVSARDSTRGSIPALSRRLRTFGDNMAADSIERGYIPSIEAARAELERCFEEVEAMLWELPAAPGGRQMAPRAEGEGARGQALRSVLLRHKDAPEVRDVWAKISMRLGEVLKELDGLASVNVRALETLEGSRLPPDRIEAEALELQAFGARLVSLGVQIQQYREFADAAQVRWVDLREGSTSRERTRLEFATAPIRVAEELKALVFNPIRTVVLTSATLAVAGRPDFIADRLGLGEFGPERFDFRTHPSPFDYRRQALTVIPTDVPSPESPAYAAALPGAVFEVLRAMGGRAFVLFTSYDLLRKTHAALAPRLAALGLTTFVQGEAGRSELLARFRAGLKNVLFGTDSFWEGVDVKGRALEGIVITRLPFRVPTEPVQEARLEELARRGFDPFSLFTVPQAVLKFKQGFGRLIRSGADRGVVVVLDPRILTRRYGRIFLDSIPETALVKAPLAASVARIEAFFSLPESLPEERSDPGRVPGAGAAAGPGPGSGSAAPGPPW